MHKFIKKYQKKLLAIFAVLLMIAFVATLGPSGMSGRGPRAQIVVGHFGKESLYENDMSAAKDQWQIPDADEGEHASIIWPGIAAPNPDAAGPDCGGHRKASGAVCIASEGRRAAWGAGQRG